MRHLRGGRRAVEKVSFKEAPHLRSPGGIIGTSFPAMGLRRVDVYLYINILVDISIRARSVKTSSITAATDSPNETVSIAHD